MINDLHRPVTKIRQLLAYLLCWLLVGATPTSGADSIEESGARFERSPNYRDGRFVNSEPTERMTAGGGWAAVQYYLSSGQSRRPSGNLPVAQVDLDQFDSDSGSAVAWLGHATVLIRINGVTVLTDPVFDEQTPLLLGRSRRLHPAPISRQNLPQIDAVLISHDHYDHLEESSVRYLAGVGVRFVVPLGVGSNLREWGVPNSQIVELDWWESVELNNVELVCPPARHFSGRSLFKLNQTLWSSWAILGPHYRVFYSGDTGFSREFASIGERYGPFDLTLIQISAYGDHWPDIHMKPSEAVEAHRAVGGETLLPVHWGTFDLALHPWDEPVKLLLEAATAESVRVIIPRPGETVSIRDWKPGLAWWESYEEANGD